MKYLHATWAQIEDLQKDTLMTWMPRFVSWILLDRPWAIRVSFLYFDRVIKWTRHCIGPQIKQISTMMGPTNDFNSSKMPFLFSFLFFRGIIFVVVTHGYLLFNSCLLLNFTTVSYNRALIINEEIY